MRRTIDETHDPELESWVDSANDGDCEFPIQNLPFTVFRPTDGDHDARIGVGIGDRVLDLRDASTWGPLATSLSPELRRVCASARLNPLLAAGPGEWRVLRHRLSKMLSADAPESSRCHDCLRPLDDVELLLPIDVGDYTDFYASIHHATNIGRLFRPDNPLLPNYKHVPIAYHGRASSIVPSGTPVRRPLGQRRPPDAGGPSFEPSRSLDYELEVGLIVGPGNEPGERIAIDEADEHLFGIALVNDWSTRDVQAWEYQPLGPFLSKSFATSVSPWIVTLDALAPFRAPAFERAADDPRPLPYLLDDDDQRQGGIDLRLEVLLRTESMRRDGAQPVRVSRQSFLDMYWTPAQMLTHHASNGCRLRPGDLLASGTVSGPGDDAAGCLLEMTCRGERPVELPGGEQRSFLEDGDQVTLRGYCNARGRRRIGLGTCTGIVEPARPRSDTVEPAQPQRQDAPTARGIG